MFYRRENPLEHNLHSSLDTAIVECPFFQLPLLPETRNFVVRHCEAMKESRTCPCSKRTSRSQVWRKISIFFKYSTDLGVSTKSVPAMTLRAESFAFVEDDKLREVRPDKADKSAIFMFDLSTRAFCRFRLISSVLLAFIDFRKGFSWYKNPKFRNFPVVSGWTHPQAANSRLTRFLCPF